MGAVGVTVPKRDLFSGAVVGEISYSPADTGTYIFWACLDTVLRADPDEINMAALVMVSEPGKARTVTKATAALKIVLDVVNKICSWPLTKIKSSTSGMSKASHAWNSFKESFTDSGKEVMFDPLEEKVETLSSGEKVRTTTYRDVFMSSTDYENATDAMNHEVASMISRYWMNRCGIPPILQMIVLRTCYKPRPVVFEARGPMSAYGEKWERESPFLNPNFIMLRRGVLMGDPLTKPVLHLVNILVRTTGEKFSDPDFQTAIFGYSGTAVSNEIRSMLQKQVSKPAVPLPQDNDPGKEEPGPSGKGPLARLLEEYPIDATQVDPVMELPESLGTVPNGPRAHTMTVEIDPSLTWNWLEARKKEKLSPSPAPVPPVQQGYVRTVGFKNPQVRNLLNAEENRRRTEELLRQQRLEQERIREIFRNTEIIPRKLPKPTQGYKQFRAATTDNFRSASSTALRDISREEGLSCTKSLLRLMGILP
jgi:hypothetical protein